MKKNHFKIILGLILIVYVVSVNYSCVSDTRAKTVLFDEGHGQLFKNSDTKALGLSKLSDVFLEDDWIVRTSDKELTDQHLKGVDALVISGAFRAVSRDEIESIKRFLERGGKLSVMLHIGPPVSDLLHSLEVSISNGVIHERGDAIIENDIDFRVNDIKDHEITTDLEDFSVYGGWALLPTQENAYVLARTSDKAWIDLNGDNLPDAQQKFATMVVGNIGSGEFVIFSDDAIFQNNFLEGNNLKLGRNLASWMAK